MICKIFHSEIFHILFYFKKSQELDKVIPNDVFTPLTTELPWYDQ